MQAPLHRNEPPLNAPVITHFSLKRLCHTPAALDGSRQIRCRSQAPHIRRARMTKIQYEDQMTKLLPDDKIHVHNSIIQEILFRAQQKRDGLRDLPLLIPFKKPAPSSRQPSKLPNGPLKKPVAPKLGIKRPHDELDSSTVKGTPSDDTSVQNAKRQKLRPVQPKKPPSDADKPKLVKPKLELPEKRSPKPKRPKPPEKTPSLPPPSPSALAAARNAASRAGALVPSTELGSYDMPFQPVEPGCGIDYELFIKLRHRMKRIAVEQAGMAEMHDDAVGAMVHAIEMRVKLLLQLAVRHRIARSSMIPCDNLQCGPVRALDLREPAKRNPSLLGEERAVDLERLSMLL
ncbi:leucine-rich repeat extensin-like protein [Gracilaria domingensis]|nr:leucine-rich repeat extensin-like protein [Gracilaria domingensis]